MIKNANVEFDKELHIYTYKGKQLQGITGMISKHLFPDMYSNVPEHILKNAAEKGTKIHEDLATTDIFLTSETFEQASYLELKDKYSIDVLDNEYFVTDYKHFATAIDKVAKIDNEYYLIDVKTTYVLNKEYLSWQLSIGHYLFERVNPSIKIKGYKAIWVKDSVCTLHDIEPIPQVEVEKLLDAEISGKLYQNFQVSTIESNKALMLIEQIELIEYQAKEAKKKQESLREELAKMFDSLGVVKWETSNFQVTKTSDYIRNSFDTKAFEKEHPELYEQFKKETKVKGSVKFKLL